MTETVIALIVGLLIDFMVDAFSFLIEVIIITQAFLPTDPFNGQLNIDSEIFASYLPQINWFVPLDYGVTLFGAFLDVYAAYVIYTYFKKIISSVLNGGSITSIISAFLHD